MIRKTWVGSYVEHKKKFAVKFVIGALDRNVNERDSLISESKKFGDLLLLTDHLDSYNNLTRKVLHTFVWVDKNTDYSFVLKIDENSFPKLDQIELEELAENHSTGVWLHHKVLQGKKESGRNQIGSCVTNTCRMHWEGVMYYLNTELLSMLMVLQLYNNEDVSVGAWISPFNLEMKRDSRFRSDMNVKKWRQDKCKDYLVHPPSIEDAEKTHGIMKTKGVLC